MTSLMADPSTLHQSLCESLLTRVHMTEGFRRLMTHRTILAYTRRKGVDAILLRKSHPILGCSEDVKVGASARDDNIG